MNRLRNHARGQVLALFCMGLVVLMGFLALAVDYGSLWTVRRQMQTAADAAAVAGINALQSGGTCSSDSCPAAHDVATINGYQDGVNGVTVTAGPLGTPPAGLANGTYVEVDVTQTVPTYFLRVLGHDTINVSTKAIAGYTNGTGCLVGLNPSANGTITISGGSSVTATNCNVIDNSTSSTALAVSAATLTANSIAVVGGYQSSGTYSPTPTTGIAPVPDPMAYLQAPTIGPCKTDSDAQTAASGSGGTIGPGVYCGGIKVQGGNTLNLSPGLYILDGGGLTVSPGTINGTGVSFFNTGTSSGTTKYGAINISGGATANLSAPTSQLTGVTGGPWEGVLFFQDRNICTGSNFCDAAGSTAGTKNVVSASGAGFVGALYFPNTPLIYSGSSSGLGYTILVADSLTVSGSSKLGSDFSSLSDGSPLKTTALYE